jgi:glutamine cyclotransferase
VGDEVFANLHGYREIVRIAIPDGRVTAWIDTRNLLKDAEVDGAGAAGELNGIAYVPESGHFLLTGKNWPRVFEVALIRDELFR